MDKNELTSLRNEIVSVITPLSINEIENPYDQFQMMIRLIQSGNVSKDIYRKAFECANSIEDSQDKLEALMTLLDEIDIDISSSDNDLDSNTVITDDK